MLHRVYTKLIALTLCIVPVVVNAKSIDDSQYNKLRTMLFSGVLTTAIFTPGDCTDSQQRQAKVDASATSGGVLIRDFLEIGGNTIAFSDEHFTVTPDGNPLLELIQYRVMDNNSGVVTVRTLSPANYEPVAEARTFHCMLGNGLRFTFGAAEHH
jgi:hypothetical protein